MHRYEHTGRARLALRGPDRVRFLHGMVTCDVEKLTPGSGSRAAMLSVKGRLLADVEVYARPDELLLSMEGALAEKVRALLDKHIVMDDVEVVVRDDLAEVSLYGDGAFAAAAALGADVAARHPYGHVEIVIDGGAVLVARDPMLGGQGVRFIGAHAIALGGEPMSPDAFEVARVEAGHARYGMDLDEERLVVEANLEDAISFDKGCYLGQEVVVRATTRGRVNRRLMGLIVDGQGAVAPGTKLSAAAHADAGVTQSSVVSERMGGPIALAYVHRAALDAGAPVTLEGGRRGLAVELPFEPSAAKAARDALRS
jgi:folate-binding protein YgfZ